FAGPRGNGVGGFRLCVARWDRGRQTIGRVPKTLRVEGGRADPMHEPARPLLTAVDARSTLARLTASPLPLAWLRVLELAQIVAGPCCGTLMAEFGAEVVKTEMPGKGDDLRRLGPGEDGSSFWFAVDNRNKKVMTLDLRQPKGQEIVRRLVPL